MTRIIFYEWEVGMKKVPFIKLLNKKAGFSLDEAKRMKDKLVDEDSTIEIIIDDELAKQITEEARQYQVLCKMESI